MKASTEPLEQAIGRNILYDRRVSEERAEHFYTFTGRPSSKGELLAALEHYLDNWLTPEDPQNTYRSTTNQGNFVTAPQTFHLGHVLNLTGVMVRASKSPLWTPDEVRELENALETAARSPHSLSAGPAMDRLLESAHRLNRNRPAWAARWTQFKVHIDLEPRSWNSAVGLSRTRASIQAILRYPARGLALIRPTQLDAGYQQYHFPSPPDLDVMLGGFAMSLSQFKGRRKWPLVSEYIHAPVRFTSDDWRRAGSAIGTCPPESLSPQLFRDAHCDRLAKLPAAKDPRIAEWIARIRS